VTAVIELLRRESLRTPPFRQSETRSSSAVKGQFRPTVTANKDYRNRPQVYPDIEHRDDFEDEFDALTNSSFASWFAMIRMGGA